MSYDGDEDVALEDVLDALLIRLLDPLLHNLNRDLKSSSKEQHIANQMEALAWIYNHYLRKSFAYLPFLDSAHLCRKAVIQRANLASYLSFENGEKTLTELSVAKACEAAGSHESPKAIDESCRVSRLSALVLSPCRKQCVLVQSLVTKSLWSFVEADVCHGSKGIPKGDIKSNSSPNKKMKLGKSKNLTNAEDESLHSILLQSVLSAVKDQTGIESAILKIEGEYLEAQCMSQETTSTRLYILICSNQCDIKAASYLENAAWVALDEILSRAAGPLVEASGWAVCPAAAIDLLHIRPFCDILQKSLSQKQIGKSCLEIPIFENGSCGKPIKTLENGVGSNISLLPIKKGAMSGSILQDAPGSKVVIVDEQEDGSPRRFSGSSGERYDSSHIYPVNKGSSRKASKDGLFEESKVKLRINSGSKGRKLSLKDLETQHHANESLQNASQELAPSSLGMHNGCQGSHLIDSLQGQTEVLVANDCQRKNAQLTRTSHIEHATAGTSSKVDMEDKMLGRVDGNEKEASKASPWSMARGASIQDIPYIRPKVQGRSLRASTSSLKEIELKSQGAETEAHHNAKCTSAGLHRQSSSEYFLLPKTVEKVIREPKGDLLRQLVAVDEEEASVKNGRACTTMDKEDTTSPCKEIITTKHIKDIEAFKEQRRQSFKRLLELTEKYQSQSEAILKDICEYDRAIRMSLDGE